MEVITSFFTGIKDTENDTRKQNWVDIQSFSAFNIFVLPSLTPQVFWN